MAFERAAAAFFFLLIGTAILPKNCACFIVICAQFSFSGHRHGQKEFFGFSFVKNSLL
jgi:hypothetical protein